MDLRVVGRGRLCCYCCSFPFFFAPQPLRPAADPVCLSVLARRGRSSLLASVASSFRGRRPARRLSLGSEPTFRPALCCRPSRTRASVGGRRAASSTGPVRGGGRQAQGAWLLGSIPVGCGGRPVPLLGRPAPCTACSNTHFEAHTWCLMKFMHQSSVGENRATVRKRQQL